MARLAIIASGSGSNFQVISEAVQKSKHEVACLICDRKNAYVFKRAEDLGIKAYYVTYYKREKLDVEKEIDSILKNEAVDLVALAGFMRIFSPYIVNLWSNKIINIHPTLLPKHPGAHGIEDSFSSNDLELGVSVHYVDDGMDTGPIIKQESFTRNEKDTLESVEKKIHMIEHQIYPEILINKLDKYNKNRLGD